MQWRLDYAEKPECPAMNVLFNSGLTGLPARQKRSVPVQLKIGLCALALIASTPASSAELGRLFFTPEQRARLDRDYARELHPDSDSSRTLSVSGIVQRHGGERTVWINGVPHLAGKSDERSPESAPVTIPGQSKQIKIKVGQKVFINPAASEQ